MTKPSRKNKTISIIIFAVLAAAFLVLAVLRLISTGSPQDEKPSSAVAQPFLSWEEESVQSPTMDTV